MRFLEPAGAVAAMALCLIPGTVAKAENIDPGDDASQYAWSENLGWIDAEPNGDGGNGIQVGDGELSGWVWGENLGWMSLSCENSLSCSSVSFGVLNDGNGVLSGFAWAENAGWISFACESTASCATADYGVEIDATTGEFRGYAWGENIGWISFNCSNTASCGTVDYKLKTGWICNPLPSVPTESPDLTMDELGADTKLSWDPVTDATGSDIVHGGLNCLRSSSSEFSSCTLGCLDDDRTTTSMLFTTTPAAGDGFWFLVRGQNCGGSGTYDTGEPSQVGSRDSEIAASGSDCS